MTHGWDLLNSWDSFLLHSESLSDVIESWRTLTALQERTNVKADVTDMLLLIQ
jgi:hypothetical protein